MRMNFEAELVSQYVREVLNVFRKKGTSEHLMTLR